MEIVDQPLDSLKPYRKNARKHSDAQISQLAKSLMEFGWCRPLAVHKGKTVIYGHGTLAAAKRLRDAGKTIPNWPDNTKAPTVDLSHLTESQRKAYTIADNRLALDSTWDNDFLADDMIELYDANFPVDVIGFNADETAFMFGIDLEPPEEEAATDSAGKYKLSLEFDTLEQQQTVMKEMQGRGIACKASGGDRA